MAKYVLVTGTHTGFEVDEKGARQFHENGRPIRKLYKEGDVVELTDAQAHAFRDKFEALEVAEARVKAAKAQAAELDRLEAAKAGTKPAANGKPVATPGKPAAK